MASFPQSINILMLNLYRSKTSATEDLFLILKLHGMPTVHPPVHQRGILLNRGSVCLSLSLSVHVHVCICVGCFQGSCSNKIQKIRRSTRSTEKGRMLQSPNDKRIRMILGRWHQQLGNSKNRAEGDAYVNEREKLGNMKCCVTKVPGSVLSQQANALPVLFRACSVRAPWCPCSWPPQNPVSICVASPSMTQHWLTTEQEHTHACMQAHAQRIPLGT